MSSTQTVQNTLLSITPHLAAMLDYRRGVDGAHNGAALREIEDGVAQLIQGERWFFIASHRAIVFFVPNAQVAKALDAFPEGDAFPPETELVLFLVTTGQPSPSVRVQFRTKLAAVGFSGKHQVFDLIRLCYDPTKHALNADVHHAVCNAEEEASVTSKFGSRDRLPKIRDTDPIAMWIGAAPGQVVRKTWVSGHEDYLHVIAA